MLQVSIRLLCTLYTGVPLANHARALQEAISIAPELQQGYELIIAVSGDGTFVPSMDVKDRDAFGALMKNNITKVAYVVLLTGFPGVAVRSILSTMSLVSGRRPEKAFGDIDAAVGWLGGKDAKRLEMWRTAWGLVRELGAAADIGAQKPRSA
jgi:hypothetical protein